MAVRWLVGGGTGNWNSTTNWSATNGGPSGASFPVAGDTANLNSAANIAVNVSSACAVLDMTGYTGIFSGVQPIAVTGNVTLGGTITYTGQFSATGAAGTQGITCNGKAFAGLFRVNTAGATVQFADAFTTAANLQLQAGTLDTNGQTVDCLTFGLLAGTKVLQLGNSHVTIRFNGAGSAWNSSTNVAGFTFTTGGASKLIFPGGAGLTTATFGASQTWDDVTWTGAAGGFTIAANNSSFRDFRGSGAGTIILGNSHWRNLDFTGATGTFSNAVGFLWTGDLTLGAAMTTSGTLTSTMIGTGIQNITTNGVTVTFGLRVAGVGNTGKFVDQLTSTAIVEIHVDGCNIISKSGVTNTCSRFAGVGSAGSLCGFSSDTPGTPTTWSIANGDQISTGLSVTDVHVTGGARWWAGRVANDNGGNAGWRFTDWNVRAIPRYFAA